MFDDNEIEVSIDLTIVAGLHIKVDRAEWAAKSHADRVTLIGEMADAAAIQLGNDVLPLALHPASISFEVIGPNNAEITPESIDVYDPEL